LVSGQKVPTTARGERERLGAISILMPVEWALLGSKFRVFAKGLSKYPKRAGAVFRAFLQSGLLQAFRPSLGPSQTRHRLA
jgi:hypothetical protein